MDEENAGPRIDISESDVDWGISLPITINDLYIHVSLIDILYLLCTLMVAPPLLVVAMYVTIMVINAALK